MLEPSDVVDLFFNHVKTLDFQAGEVIFTAGEKGDRMFALMKGEVELWLNDGVVESIHEHDVFGEGALVQLDHTRVTTAIAKTDCKLAELNKERFLFLLQETPLFALEIVRSLSSRLRKIKQKTSI
ncbi:cyclic nucleotide-binding domain-containing protein [Geminocystis sp. NIES-3709]|uniref:cyclic nucleotide-binding domain-containing protein n=1 Tax=Geminocystis sp. NIES-3709 TaxID=1617448 RepID=UPI0005FC70AF|nr:cyclic nucleotide-binding domain-containing protein [Geminocystis sp. NIES-3709]BAQ64401.1 cAMP-binding proteins - catabolite gene activator and regulatory subunit of cAMP-dependent protein kinases [Geminocystis sp. NIES-3709]